MSAPPRRLGNQVVRRRVRTPQIIEIPKEPARPGVPHARAHAKWFVLAFAALVAVGTILLALPWTTESGEATPVVDALFTAVSAASVTGLVIVDTADHWNTLGEVVILLLIQAGGLGFMVGASIVLQVLRRQTGLRESLLMQDGAPALSPREAVSLSGRILRFTLVTEAIGAIVLTLLFLPDMPRDQALWYGVFHAVSAFCNAGFDLQGEFRSLIPYQASVWVNVVVMLLIQLGALAYIVLAEAATERRWRTLSLDAKIVLLSNALLLVIGAVAFLAAEASRVLADIPVWNGVLAAIFQSVAARTAGFATVNLGETSAFVLFVWIGMMMIGGAPGSTAGGVKLTTVGVVIVAIVSTLRGQGEPQVFGRRIPTPVVFRAMSIIALFLLSHFATTLALVLAEGVVNQAGLAFIALMFEAMSALATVGLSTGITPALSTASELILIAAMFFGRIGPLTAVYALQRRQHRVRYRYPEAAVRIG